MAQNLDDFIAGWISGAVATLVTQPVDTYLTNKQAVKYGLLAHKIKHNQWFRGTAPLLLGMPLNNALIFYGYGVGKSVADRHKNNDRILPIFVGGCVGGLLQSFIASPVELLKTRMQLLPAVAASASEMTTPAAKNLASICASGHSHSFSSFFSQGLTATILRDVIPHGVWFASYEMAKDLFSHRTSSNDTTGSQLSIVSQLSAGGIAATVAWGVGYPFDILKTRCQAPASLPPSVMEAGKQLYLEGGVAAFYRGFGLKLCRAIPMNAIGFLVYEECMKALAFRHN